MQNTPMEQVERWLCQPDLEAEIREELEALKKACEEERADAGAAVKERFYRDLEFGTAGMRGILGAGSNRMNIYTVRRITQGFADHINAGKSRSGAAAGQTPAVAIGFDNRIHSDLFAFESACVLLANGISAHIYPALAPTPALSFAVRHCGCDAGIMITASHNTKEYNGYKVYDATGGQCLPEEADAISARIEKVDLFRDVKTVAGRFPGTFEEKLTAAAAAFRAGGGAACFVILSGEVSDAFSDAVFALSMGRQDFSDLSVAYTPLHGTGNLPVRRILDRIGVKNLHIVTEQEAPDGNFPTCPYPNPEKREALAMGLALCEKLKAAGQTPDILLATDPDCDRVGVAVFHKGEYRLLSGNEAGILLLDFICRSRKAAGTMPARPVAVKTIVSSPMAAAVASAYGVETVNVLTGFKFIGEQISLLAEKGEADRYIFGFEESCGYMSGTHVRDKDAVNACMLLAELAAECKAAGTTVAGRMEELYETYGYYENSLLEFTMEGEAGMERIGRVMACLRSTLPETLFGAPVAEYADYLSSERRTGADGSGHIEAIDLPQSDVLEYIFTDGGAVIVRPSGTEPKLKIYLAVKGATGADANAATRTLKDLLKKQIDSI
ncbi:MAG: phospho-sugar mutase [Clostridiales Family XIII bacterium]|jgi:phosphoglucomutase|nr:phospho-sugar mutase [Clostridiales Family XIII bacterium]